MLTMNCYRLLHDLLYAEYMHGSFDDCLFTLNKPHLHNHPYRDLMIAEDMDEERDADEKYAYIDSVLRFLRFSLILSFVADGSSLNASFKDLTLII